jgi:hypothetical protein
MSHRERTICTDRAPPPSSHHQATIKPPSSHHQATIKPPSSHHQATIKPPPGFHGPPWRKMIDFDPPVAEAWQNLFHGVS